MSLNDKISDALIDQYLLGTISDVDRKRLSDWFNSFSDQEVKVLLEKRSSKLAAKEAIWGKIEKRIGINITLGGKDNAVAQQRARQRRLLRIGAVAAACFLLVFLGRRIFLGENNIIESSIVNSPQEQLEMDHNGAVLTLSNGTVIQLDSMGSGQIALQGAAKVVQKGNQVFYEQTGNSLSQGLSQATRMINTMTTPRGKQFSLVLPDGTKVWLNAASSISYPVRFDPDKRKVDITGEVYFEVKHLLSADRHSRVPFEVHTGAVVIDVLGTHFDVKNYDNEKSVKATLVEGSIKVINKQTSKTKMIDPGQQASIDKTGSGNIAVQNVDATGQIAWKEGLFNFKDERLGEILKQVERWYDVNIDADPAKKRLRFSGVVSKREKLSDLLKVLSATGVVEFKINEQGIYGY